MSLSLLENGARDTTLSQCHRLIDIIMVCRQESIREFLGLDFTARLLRSDYRQRHKQAEVETNSNLHYYCFRKPPYLEGYNIGTRPLRGKTILTKTWALEPITIAGCLEPEPRDCRRL